MRRFLLALFCLVMAEESYAFDISGLQPVAPYGVFSTFSAESLPKNKVSAEVLVEISREPDFFRYSLKSAYGVRDNLEFILTVPYVTGLDDSAEGFQDISLGFKHRFYDEGKYGPSLAYLLNASIPSGRDDLSVHGRVGIGFILSKRIGPFSGHFNIFYERAGQGMFKDELSFLSGVEFAATNNLKILGEILIKKSHFSNEYDQVETRLGYRIQTTEAIYTSVGIALDLKNRAPEYRLMLSLTLTNAQSKKKIKKVYEEEP